VACLLLAAGSLRLIVLLPPFCRMRGLRRF
jgi:hypothetical protein